MLPLDVLCNLAAERFPRKSGILLFLLDLLDLKGQDNDLEILLFGKCDRTKFFASG